MTCHEETFQKYGTTHDPFSCIRWLWNWLKLLKALHLRRKTDTECLAISLTSRGLTIPCRLRVVPHFSSGIVERAKSERAWKSPHARKCDTRPAARRLFSRGMIFTRARVSLALLSLRENGGLLVVYIPCSFCAGMKTIPDRASVHT